VPLSPTRPAPFSFKSSSSHDTGGSDDSGGLYAATTVQIAFHFPDCPADVPRAATACRRWRELACAGLVWRVKAEREGIFDKAASFEVDDMPVEQEGDETAMMAFYARVFVLKGYKMRDEDLDDDRKLINNPDHDGGIYTAVDACFADSAAAKAKYGPIASWDTSGITNMYRLFCNRKDFNEDISRWNVSNVVNMNGMFYGATSFNGDLSRWNVSSVLDMYGMFEGATLFNGDLSHWDATVCRAWCS